MLHASCSSEFFQMPPAQATPLRILCLHGFGQSRERLAAICEPLTRALPEVTWSFLSAPHHLPPLKKGSSVREHRCWFWYNEDDQGDLTNMLSAPVYYGLDASLEAVRDEVRKGNINGLLGFSQGAVLVHAATQDEEICRQLQAAILILGCC